MSDIQIGSIVTFKGCFCAAEVKSIIGKTAVVEHCGELLNKRMSSLRLYVTKRAYWNEQELAEGQAKYDHGSVVFAELNDSGTGSVHVWDEIEGKVVTRKEFEDNEQDRRCLAKAMFELECGGYDM